MSLYSVIGLLFTIYYWMIIAYIFMSWVPNLRETQVGQIIGKLVEPYLKPFRKIIPPLGMIDISPIVAVISLYFIQIGVVTVLEMLFGGF